MNDEIFLYSNEDSALERVELKVVENIRNQITNKYGEFTGELASQTDFILEYINTTFAGSAYDTIKDFENVCNISNMEDVYDILTTKLVALFRDIIGVSVNVDREIVTFKDLYDIYVIFVLSLKDTVILSTKQHYHSKGLNISKFTTEVVSEYILTDEFCTNDNFIKNASIISGNDAINSIQERIDDFLITVNHEIFIDYIYKYIVEILF